MHSRFLDRECQRLFFPHRHAVKHFFFYLRTSTISLVGTVLGGLCTMSILLQCHSTNFTQWDSNQAGLPGERERTGQQTLERKTTQSHVQQRQSAEYAPDDRSPRTFSKVTSRLVAEHGWTLTRRETSWLFDGSWPSISAGIDVMMVFRRTPERRRCGPGGSFHHFRQSRISCN